MLAGGLFDGDTDDAELAFQYAVEAVNNEKLSYSNYQLEAQAVQVKYGDQFDVSKKLCRLLKVRSSSKSNGNRSSSFVYMGGVNQQSQLRPWIMCLMIESY